MKPTLTALILGLTLGLPAWAGMDHMNRDGAMSHASMADAASEGTVKKVDRARGRLTIRHGPLKNLGMPAMTMNFRVRDRTWLERLKPGDHIRFHADQVNGLLTASRIEIVQ